MMGILRRFLELCIVIFVCFLFSLELVWVDLQRHPAPVFNVSNTIILTTSPENFFPSYI